MFSMPTSFLSRTWTWLWMLDTRSTEILLGLILLVRGSVWISPFGDISGDVYKPLSSIMSVAPWGVLFVSLGLFQIMGVIINGRWRRSPYLRRGVLFFSLVFYTVLAVSFSSTLHTGGGMQATTQQALLAICCFWCLVNVASKNGHSDD